MQEIKDTIKKFGKIIGVNDLEFDEFLTCSLLIGDTVLNVQWKEAQNKLLVYAPVGNIDSDNKTELFAMLLEANNLGIGTAGLTLGIFPELNSIILSGQIPCSPHAAEELSRFVLFFSEQAEDWKRRILHQPQVTVSETAAADLQAGIRV